MMFIHQKQTLIISGTRNTVSSDYVLDTVYPLILTKKHNIYVGDCPTGVDKVIRDSFDYCDVFYADWNKYGKYAGPKRNRQMIDARVGYTTLVAFPSSSSKGTIDAINYAKHVGLEVLIFMV